MFNSLPLASVTDVPTNTKVAQKVEQSEVSNLVSTNVNGISLNNNNDKYIVAVSAVDKLDKGLDNAAERNSLKNFNEEEIKKISSTLFKKFGKLIPVENSIGDAHFSVSFDRKWGSLVFETFDKETGFLISRHPIDYDKDKVQSPDIKQGLIVSKKL